MRQVVTLVVQRDDVAQVVEPPAADADVVTPIPDVVKVTAVCPPTAQPAESLVTFVHRIANGRWDLQAFGFAAQASSGGVEDDATVPFV